MGTMSFFGMIAGDCNYDLTNNIMGCIIEKKF